MGDNRYIFESDDSDLAAIRLERLERFLDPATFRGLDRVGVPRGGRSLEIGAGRGSAVLHMLARSERNEIVHFACSPDAVAARSLPPTSTPH